MKKTQMWPSGSDSFGPLKYGGMGMDTSWMRPPQQRFGPMVPSPQNGQYRALAAAALQEFRNGDSSKQLLSQSVPSSHLPFRQQQAQSQPQQLMQHINDIPGPLLQLSTSQTQTTDLGNPGMASASYRESDLHMASSTTMSSSFGLQDMMVRAPTSTPLSSSEGNQLASMMQITSQNGLQSSGPMPGLIQVLAIFSYNCSTELVEIHLISEHIQGQGDDFSNVFQFFFLHLPHSKLTIRRFTFARTNLINAVKVLCNKINRRHSICALANTYVMGGRFHLPGFQTNPTPNHSSRPNCPVLRLRPVLEYLGLLLCLKVTDPLYSKVWDICPLMDSAIMIRTRISCKLTEVTFFLVCQLTNH